MSGKYTEAHKNDNLGGPGDDRPTALQIIKDEHLFGNMKDKGCSSGIGPATSRAFAATGTKVFMTVRDLKKGEEACKYFLEPGRVELLEMDNSSLDSVRAAANAFLAKSNKLNVLVCNASIMASPYSKTKDGFESQFQTNQKLTVDSLAHFLFFNLLKDTMLKSSTPEFNSWVVNVSSIGHKYGEINFGNYDFSDGKDYTPWAGYGQSKTANVYMASHIHTLYGSKGLHGLSLDPGRIMTGLQKHVPDETKKNWKLIISDETEDGWKLIPNIENFMKSTEQGAATSLLAAVDKVYEGKGKLYLVNCATVEQEASEEKEKRLWEDSLKMVNLA